MNEKKHTIWCPLQLINKPYTLAECLGERCAMYVPEKHIGTEYVPGLTVPGGCAIQRLAETLDDIYRHGLG